jgi:hypothetical protein
MKAFVLVFSGVFQQGVESPQPLFSTPRSERLRDDVIPL